MPEVAAPLWLAALVPALLLVWWLHRFREHPLRNQVSAVFLWRDLRQPASPGNRMERADPVWLLRALIVALLLIALSGTAWIGASERHITVWFDDSLSMKVKEARGSRWSLAAVALRQALEEEGAHSVEVRSLTRPGKRIGLPSGDWDAILARLQSWFRAADADAIRRLPSLPLDPGEHWVVTDGAGEMLRPWLERAAIDRIVQVGKETENSAVTRLGVRRSLGRADRIEGLVRVWNGGKSADERRLELAADGQAIGEWRIAIPAGRTLSHSFTLPFRGDRRIVARLLPSGRSTGDRLPADDRLSVRLLGAEWQPRVVLSGACGLALKSALESLPGIAISRDGGDQGGDVSVSCAATAPKSSGPAIWFPPQDAPRPASGPLRWSPQAGRLGRLMLDPDRLRTGSAAVDALARPLLVSGEQPLILRHPPAAGVLEVRLDMASSPFVRQPAFPLLLSGLLELATGHPLLDRVLASQRDPGESRITPRALPTLPSRSPVDSGRPKTADPTGWLVLAAIGLLLYDIGRTAPRLRHRTATGSSVS